MQSLEGMLAEARKKNFPRILVRPHANEMLHLDTPETFQSTWSKSNSTGHRRREIVHVVARRNLDQFLQGQRARSILSIYQQPRNSCRRQTNLLQAEVIGIIRRYVMTRLSLTHQRWNSMTKWWKQARTSKEVVIKSDHVKFVQMLIAENWTLKMNNILCRPLGPWALASVDGLIAEEN